MTRLTPTQRTQIRELADRAAACAMHYYQNAFSVTIKSDSSPVTQADIAVSELLEQALPAIANYHVLSEENQPSSPQWKAWETYWLVDPIDGTRHFINGSGEFCICIALIHQGQPVFGLIISPVTDEMWLGQLGNEDEPDLLEKYHAGKYVSIPTTPRDKVTVTLGTSALSKRMKILLSELPDYTWYTRGSALKFIDLVEGRANIYPKMWDICEWDCAAGQCLVICAGGKIQLFNAKGTLRYGESDSLITPHFFAHNNLTETEVEQVRKMYRHVPAHQG